MRFFNEPAENEQNPKYPCGICNKNVSSRFKALKCQNCGYWNHIRCDGIPVNMYDKIAKQSKCNVSSLPFLPSFKAEI